MSTIQPEELALASTSPRRVRAAVARALRERARAHHSPRAAARLARDFLGRLDRSGACTMEGASPRILALVVGRLHEDYCDVLNRWEAPRRRGRGRPKGQTTDLETNLLLLLSAIPMSERDKARRAAEIVLGFWGVRVSPLAILDRARKGLVYVQPALDRSERARKVRRGRREQIADARNRRPRD